MEMKQSKSFNKQPITKTNSSVRHILILAVLSVDLLRLPSGNQLRESIYKWLSPPDPSTNPNIARGIHHKGTANWFFEGSTFREWKEMGSLLWIHGKRAP